MVIDKVRRTGEVLKSLVFSSYFLQLMFGMLGALILLTILTYTPPFEAQRIATVDITHIADSFIKTESALNLPKEVLQQRVNIFGHVLEISIKKLSAQKHLVILPKEAVMAGAPDMTKFIQNDLNKFMPKESEQSVLGNQTQGNIQK